MKINKFAPVLIPTLDRYEHFKRCVNSLAKNTHALNTILYIALDAPTKRGHKEGRNKIIKYLSNISGFKKVIVIKRNKNFGASRNIIEAERFLFKKYNEIILSEDDNYFSPNFLDYMNKGLQIFKHRKDVYAVCGYNYSVNIPLDYPHNFYLFKGVPCWGIGLWKKSDNIDLSVGSVKKFLKSYRNFFKIYKEAKYLIPFLFDVVTNNLIAGDVIRSMNLVKNNTYCVLPIISKVRNYGHDGTGVNCLVDKENMFINQPIDNDRYFDFSTPENKVIENKELTDLVQKKLENSNVEVFKRGLLFLVRNTNLHNYYLKMKNIFTNV